MEKTLEELILAQLTALSEKVDKVRSEDIPSLRERMKGVEVKSALMGAITGSVGGSAVAALLIKFLM